MDTTLVERLVDTGAELLLLLLIAAAGAAVRKWKVSADRQAFIGRGIGLAYGAVAELARRTETTVDDKAALALKKLGEYLVANQLPPLTVGEIAGAKLSFDSMHAAEKGALGALALPVPAVAVPLPTMPPAR